MDSVFHALVSYFYFLLSEPSKKEGEGWVARVVTRGPEPRGVYKK